MENPRNYKGFTVEWRGWPPENSARKMGLFRAVSAQKSFNVLIDPSESIEDGFASANRIIDEHYSQYQS